MILPRKRAALLFAASAPPALILLLAAGAYWYTALYMPLAILVMMLLDLSMMLPARRLRAELRAPRQLPVGPRAVASLRLEAADYARSLTVQALLEQDGPAEAPQMVEGRLRRGPVELEAPITPLRRGRLRIKALWLRWSGPLGLLETRVRRPLDFNVDIVPDVRGLHEEALRFFAQDAVYGSKSQRFKGQGTEFDTLCDYAPGMDNRFIDWKRSARHRKLLCKEFRQERNHQIIFGFDTGRLMLEPVGGLSRLDHAIRAGLLLSWISLHSGDLVGGCGFDARFRAFIKAGRGMPYFRRFQRFTAGLDYHEEETNFTLALVELNGRLQRRALVILFTDFVDQISAELLLESLRLITRRHVVIFVSMRDPLLTRRQSAAPNDFYSAAQAVIADDFLRERAVVMECVARLGVHCLDVPAPALRSALLNRYLLIKQRGLL